MAPPRQASWHLSVCAVALSAATCCRRAKREAEAKARRAAAAEVEMVLEAVKRCDQVHIYIPQLRIPLRYPLRCLILVLCNSAAESTGCSPAVQQLAACLPILYDCPNTCLCLYSSNMRCRFHHSCFISSTSLPWHHLSV